MPGVGQRAAAAEPAKPVPSMRGGRGGAPAPKRSLVRTAIALLLQKPMLSEVIQPPYRFAVLRQPGIPLLVELLELVRDRPGITTGAVLEHFAGREEEPALQKLALQGFPGEESAWGHELVDALVQLDRQVNQQRIDELQARIREVGMSGLSDAETFLHVVGSVGGGGQGRQAQGGTEGQDEGGGGQFGSHVESPAVG